MTPNQIASAICKDVAELADRNSPADWPEAMLVTADELRTIVLAQLENAATPIAWGAFYLGGKHDGQLYNQCPTEEMVKSYIDSVHQSNDSITLSHGPLFAAPPFSEASAEGLPFGIIDPDYATAYTKTRIAAWQYGYAIALQGSFTRDLDLLAVPWTERACDFDTLIAAIEYRTGLKRQAPPSDKPHGRKAVSLLFPGFEDPRWVDLSILPRAAEPLETKGGA